MPNAKALGYRHRRPRASRLGVFVLHRIVMGENSSDIYLPVVAWRELWDVRDCAGLAMRGADGLV